MANAAIITIVAKIIAVGIHNGAVTHHQLHAIFSVNLRTKNTINKIPQNPVPLVLPPVLILAIKKSPIYSLIHRRLYYIFFHFIDKIMLP